MHAHTQARTQTHIQTQTDTDKSNFEKLINTLTDRQYSCSKDVYCLLILAICQYSIIKILYPYCM